MKVGFCLRGETVSGGGGGSPGPARAGRIEVQRVHGIPTSANQPIHFPVPGLPAPPPRPHLSSQVNANAQEASSRLLVSG